MRGFLRGCLLVLALAAAALPAVFLNTLYGYLPVLFLGSALALSLLCLLWVRRCLETETRTGEARCRRGETVEITLALRNRSRLFCPRAEARVFISDLLGETDSEKTVALTLPPRVTLDFAFSMDMSHVGVCTVGLEQLELCDFFGVFRVRVPLNCRLTVCVAPRRVALESVSLPEDALRETERDTRVTTVGGSDYTGVRGYTWGDPMKQIHWKLSAHSREYVTKLQESFRRREFTVILDFAAEPDKDRERLLDVNDCLMETALSLLDEMTRQEAACTLLYCRKDGQIERAQRFGGEADWALVRSAAGITTATPFPDACQLLQREGLSQNRSANVAVVTSRVTPELLLELGRVKAQRRSPALYAVVPAELSGRELSAFSEPLRQLGDQDIPYYLVSTAQNHVGGPGQ